MRLLDSRRLTGINIHGDHPGAIAEVSLDSDADAELVIVAWRLAVTAALTALGWPVALAVRCHDDGHGHRGADLVFVAPEDALYTATEINDWAVAWANLSVSSSDFDDTTDRRPRSVEDMVPQWRAGMAKEARPKLAALRAAAAERDVPLLIDDELVSLGHGHASRVWPVHAMPTPDAVPWPGLARIPTALITGTNGKTTTARLLARIAQEAGYTPGNTSTDGLVIAGEMVEAGDLTGPMSARTVLRHPAVDFAVLEVARGGILRRGLAVDRCDAAAVLNVSDDHLGEYGIYDVATMARVKAVVTRAVAASGRVVLGADNPPVVALAQTYAFPAPVVWFGLSADHPQIHQHLAAGGEAWFVADGQLTRGVGASRTAVVAVSAIPLCFAGRAKYNVANCLAAAALASAMELPDPAIVRGLTGFTAADNPGRAQSVEIAGVQVFLDFAHNPEGFASVASVLALLRGHGRMVVSLGLPGDRDAAAIAAVAASVSQLAPDRVLLRDIEHYLRGREPGEMPRLITQALVAKGLAAETIATVSGEVAALREGLAWAGPGDLVAILVHVERDAMRAELQRLTT